MPVAFAILKLLSTLSCVAFECDRQYTTTAIAPTLSSAATVVASQAQPVTTGDVSLVIDISENREYLYQGQKLLETHPVSTGCVTCFEIPYYTPVGKWRIARKLRTDPSGQYGPYFLALDKWDEQSDRYIQTAIGLHGTNQPELIGQPASHGCIRHENAIISYLAQILPLGTRVITLP